MANTPSDLITNIYARPRVLNKVSRAHGALYGAVATTAVLAADVDARIYPVVRLPADARIWALFVANSAIAGGTDYDLGVYNAGDWTQADQAAKDADILVDGISMATARDEMIDPAQVLAAAIGSIFNCLGQGTNAITGIQMFRELWEHAGDAAEPQAGTEYDLAWTANTVGTAAGTIKTAVLYTVNA
jgi:hypothetical protein